MRSRNKVDNSETKIYTLTPEPEPQAENGGTSYISLGVFPSSVGEMELIKVSSDNALSNIFPVGTNPPYSSQGMFDYLNIQGALSTDSYGEFIGTPVSNLQSSTTLVNDINNNPMGTDIMVLAYNFDQSGIANGQFHFGVYSIFAVSHGGNIDFMTYDFRPLENNEDPWGSLINTYYGPYNPTPYIYMLIPIVN